MSLSSSQNNRKPTKIHTTTPHPSSFTQKGKKQNFGPKQRAYVCHSPTLPFRSTTMTTASTVNNLQSLIYTNEGGRNPKLAVLDQLLIPAQKTYIPVPNIETAWTVIRTMQIRGRFLVCDKEKEAYFGNGGSPGGLYRLILHQDWILDIHIFILAVCLTLLLLSRFFNRRSLDCHCCCLGIGSRLIYQSIHG